MTATTRKGKSAKGRTQKTTGTARAAKARRKAQIKAQAEALAKARGKKVNPEGGPEAAKGAETANAARAAKAGKAAEAAKAAGAAEAAKAAKAAGAAEAAKAAKAGSEEKKGSGGDGGPKAPGSVKEMWAEMIGKMADPEAAAKMFDPAKMAEMLDPANMFDTEKMAEMLDPAKMGAFWDPMGLAQMWNPSALGGLFDPMNLMKMMNPQAMGRMGGAADMAHMLDPEGLARLWDPFNLAKMWDPAHATGGTEAMDWARLWDPFNLAKAWDPAHHGAPWDPANWAKMFDPANLAKMFDPANWASMLNPTSWAAMFHPEKLARMFDPENLSKMFDPAMMGKMFDAGNWGAMLNPVAWAPMLDPANLSRMMDPANFAKMFDPQILGRLWDRASGQTGAMDWSAAASAEDRAGRPWPLWVELAPALMFDTARKCHQQTSEYLLDLGQRWVLYMDTLRQRGNIMLEHRQAGMPPLLAYEYELVMDGGNFDRPVNYRLLRIIPPDGKKPAKGRRPLVIIDPRAGHGPGIGGFKQDSEVGMGLREGHPVYFVVFSPMPIPGQTIEDVELAQARFIEEVHRLHPNRGHPMVYGNCQAGWAVAMLGADRPDVTGPIVINGAPMSYWAGGAGINPMRVSGGLLGGTWLTRFLCDLGHGIFDGAHLVTNFENLNPANTFWKKDYNLLARVDREQKRYLDFERWWTGFYFMNEEEILWIVNNLFVGDKLEKGMLKLSPKHAIDMRNMDDPLVIFASSKDNITPPQQALHWISELYPTTEDLKKAGQRIVYLINPHVGHLGIFVSAKVARREHRAIIEHIERIRKLKPGLYQMFIVKETGEPDPLKDQFVVKFEERDVKAVCFPFDRQAFEKMLAVSRANEEFYLRYMRPFIRPLCTPWMAEMLRWLNPARVSRYIYSDRVNPAMGAFKHLATQVKQNRKPVDASNALRYAEQRISENIVSLLDAYRDLRDNAAEVLFDMIYM